MCHARSPRQVPSMTSDPPKLVPANKLINTFLIGNPDSTRYSITDGIIRDPNIPLPLDAALNLAESDPIWINRGKAIQSYATLEQALCRLLAELADTNYETAATIFYKITNTGSRSGILESLLHKKHGTKFNLFWNQYFKDLRQIDLKRNAIVHWLTAMNVATNTHQMMITGLGLIPPGSMGSNRPTEQINSTELIDFTEKCLSYQRLCNMFSGVTTTKHDPPDDDTKRTWLEIFQRPLVYPLPEDHPLNQTPITPDIPPQSSLGVTSTSIPGGSAPGRVGLSAIF